MQLSKRTLARSIPFALLVVLSIQLTAQQQTFGGAFRTLTDAQQQLLVEFAQRRAEVTDEQVSAEQMYNSAPESVRTTFQAVTHALLNTKLETEGGGDKESAITLVRAVEEVLGERHGAGGDEQYRIYVQLVPRALDKLRESRNFGEGHNGVFHGGFPLSFRTRGTPSVQFSVTEDGSRADIDVDYRSSAPLKALFDGHLSAHNSDVRPRGNYQKHVRQWQGLLAWWQGLFGPHGSDHEVYIAEVDPTLFGESPLPEAARGDFDEAINDFLSQWLIKRNFAGSLAYFDERTHPCVHMPDGQLVRTHRTARLELYRELRVASVALGEVKALEDVMVRTAPWRPDLLRPVASTQPYTVFEASPEAWSQIDCARAAHPSFYFEATQGEEFYKDARGAVLNIREPNGKNLILHQIWQKRDGAWRIIGFSSGDVLPNHRLAVAASTRTAVANQVKEIDGHTEQISEAESFYRNWLVDRDYSAALEVVDPASYGCWTGNNRSKASEVRKALREAAETTGAHSSLKTVIRAVRPSWYLQQGVVVHDQDEIFDVATGPAEVVTKHFPCYKGKLPTGDTFVTTAEIVGPRSGHAAMLLWWAHPKKGWQIVAAQVESH